MELSRNVYLLGPQYGIGSNPSGGEILIAPVDMVDSKLFDLPGYLWFATAKPLTLTQAVPPWNARQAAKHDDGIPRLWVYVPVRTTTHTEGPLGAPVDGGRNAACRYFPGWEAYNNSNMHAY